MLQIWNKFYSSAGDDKIIMRNGTTNVFGEGLLSLYDAISRNNANEPALLDDYEQTREMIKFETFPDVSVYDKLNVEYTAERTNEDFVDDVLEITDFKQSFEYYEYKKRENSMKKSFKPKEDEEQEAIREQFRVSSKFSAFHFSDTEVSCKQIAVDALTKEALYVREQQRKRKLFSALPEFGVCRLEPVMSLASLRFSQIKDGVPQVVYETEKDIMREEEGYEDKENNAPIHDNILPNIEEQGFDDIVEDEQRDQHNEGSDFKKQKVFDYSDFGYP
jgi:hypothetical protein